MATIQVTLRKKKNKAGLYPICIRITKNRKCTFMHLGQYIEIQNWDGENNRVKKTHPNYKRLNNFILAKLSKINKSLLDIESDNSPITQIEEIKNKIQNRNKNHSFYEFAESHFQELERNKKYSRINAERPLLNRIKRYPKAKNLTFEAITPQFLRGFISYLRSSKNNIGERTIVNNLIFIRTLYNRATHQNLISKDLYPFGNSEGKIKIRIPKSIKIGLTAEEITILETLDLSDDPKQHHARNVFLFSFYLAGMRVADALKMKWANVQGERIYYTMSKNHKNLSLKIHNKLQKILDEYHPNKTSEKDYIFPELQNATNDPKDILRLTKIGNKKLNRYLRQIAHRANITKKLTMHVARHSFGNISGDRIPLQVLQKLYNHSDIKTTIEYQQNFINKDLDDALDLVIGA
ncbi:MAG: site-specific integrase [Arenibacter latericius]|nr:site-specific integrase [Arenibacter latericius]